MVRIARDGDYVNRFRLVRVHVDHEAEIGRQVAADLVPGIASVVGAHDVPVFLHEEHIRARRVHRDAVNAVADVGSRLGNGLRVQSAVNGLPRLAGIVAAKSPGGGDRDEDPARVAGIEDDRVQAHPTGAWLPAGPGAVMAQSGELLPAFSSVARAKDRGVFDTRIDRIGICERRFQVPDSLELPGVWCAIVPLVRAGGSFVGELVIHRLPSLAAVAGALDYLPKPAAGLRCV